MLDQAHEIIGEANMIVHSDRGFHYRLGCWISRMDNYGYIRSMSKKAVRLIILLAKDSSEP